jgi:RNA recognition motif-containing protein
MRSQRSRRPSKRYRRDGRARRAGSAPAPAKKPGFFARLLALFKSKPANGKPHPKQQPERSSRKPEAVEVTTARLYVGNLSYDATESDLFDLFNGVGKVQNAEVVTNRHTQRSKGFAFVQMQTLEEARRAVEELHDKEFLGRKLVVSGAKKPHAAEV